MPQSQGLSPPSCLRVNITGHPENTFCVLDISNLKVLTPAWPPMDEGPNKLHCYRSQGIFCISPWPLQAASSQGPQEAIPLILWKRASENGDQILPWYHLMAFNGTTLVQKDRWLQPLITSSRPSFSDSRLSPVLIRESSWVQGVEHMQIGVQLLPISLGPLHDTHIIYNCLRHLWVVISEFPH